MLAELAIHNLVLIAEARLEFSQGLNVITGETGAGKTLLAQAIGLLMGQKGGEELIRPGADRALVQALFETHEGSLAVARELPRGGRSRARLDGLMSSAAAVEDALQQRLAFYGQLEQTRLLQLEQQLRLLDAAAPLTLAPLLEEYSSAYEEARAREHAFAALQATRDERDRELELLRFQVSEIEAAGLAPGEDARLGRERERLRHAGRLMERVGGALSLMAGEQEEAALDAIRRARRLVDEAVNLDETLRPAAERLASVDAELDDVATQLRTYLDALDVDPTQRDAIELRYDKVKTLARKYGGSADAALAHCDAARRRIREMESMASEEEDAAAALAAAQQRALSAASRLSDERRRVAPLVAARIEEELHALAMPHATFAIALRNRGRGWSALGPAGADDVEFVFSANPGVPARPLRDTASGGELSRVMLALRGIITLGDDVETLIFDEVDQGIGGVTASALGERLAHLAERRQVLCITHLPQVAAFADRHFAIVKESDPHAGTTRTSVRLVAGEERVSELCRMLGADAGDRAARQHAAALLAKAGRTA